MRWVIRDAKEVCLSRVMFNSNERKLIRERQVLIHDGKGSKPRVVPLFKGGAGALKDYLALRRTLLRGPDTGILFLSERGTRLDSSTFCRWLRGWAKKTIGRPVNPHLLQHSIAVHLLRGGADIRHVQELLGHRQLETTKVYLRMTPGHLRAEYEAAMPELV